LCSLVRILRIPLFLLSPSGWCANSVARAGHA
jgi:hypothetical protein